MLKPENFDVKTIEPSGASLARKIAATFTLVAGLPGWPFWGHMSKI